MFGVNAWDSYGTRLSFRADEGVDEGTTNEREQPDPTCRGANRESLNQDDASLCGDCLEGYTEDENNDCVAMESADNGDSDDSQEDAEQPEEILWHHSTPKPASNNYLGYAILGGIGVMAFGYLYFMIRNPKAYVQATAIRTGGNLLGQALTS